MPRVSVIMPCYNHGNFVGQSANAVLSQSMGDLELIIVDDCSSDHSWDVITRLMRAEDRVRGVRHERNQGASASRNCGLRLATGEFVGFCDADDVWEQRKLSAQLKLLSGREGYDVAYSDAVIIDEHGCPTGERFSDWYAVPSRNSGEIFMELLSRNFINIQTVIMKKCCVDDSGYFDERVRWVEDWWYWINVANRHRFAYSPELLARYRVHPQSTRKVQARGYQWNRFKVFRRILKKFDNLPRSMRAEIFRQMGAELSDLGRRQCGKRVLWKAAAIASRDVRAYGTLARALARMAVSWSEFKGKEEGCGIHR